MSRILRALKQIDSRTPGSKETTGDGDQCAATNQPANLDVDAEVVIPTSEVSKVDEALDSISDDVAAAVELSETQPIEVFAGQLESVEPPEPTDVAHVDSDVASPVEESIYESSDGDARDEDAASDETVPDETAPVEVVSEESISVKTVSDETVSAEIETAEIETAEVETAEVEDSADEERSISDMTEPDSLSEQSGRPNREPLPPLKSPVEMIDELSKLLNVRRPAKSSFDRQSQSRETTEEPDRSLDVAAVTDEPATVDSSKNEDRSDQSFESQARVETSAPESSRAGDIALPSNCTPFEESLVRNLQSNRLAEQYHRIATAVTSTTSLDVPVSMNCVSVGRSTPATHALAHLGVTLAKQNIGKIVIVDCDFRAHALTRQLEKLDGPGVAEHLERSTQWRQAITSTSFERLDFLPAGKTKISNVSRVAPGFAKLVHELKAEYQFVLIDSGATENALPQTLGRYCDLTYLLIELGSTEIDQARDIATKLRSSGSRIVGCIVTEPSSLFAA